MTSRDGIEDLRAFVYDDVEAMNLNYLLALSNYRNEDVDEGDPRKLQQFKAEFYAAREKYFSKLDQAHEMAKDLRIEISDPDELREIDEIMTLTEYPDDDIEMDYSISSSDDVMMLSSDSPGYDDGEESLNASVAGYVDQLESVVEKVEEFKELTNQIRSREQEKEMEKQEMFAARERGEETDDFQEMQRYLFESIKQIKKERSELRREIEEDVQRLLSNAKSTAQREQYQGILQLLNEEEDSVIDLTDTSIHTPQRSPPRILLTPPSPRGISNDGMSPISPLRPKTPSPRKSPQEQTMYFSPQRPKTPSPKKSPEETIYYTPPQRAKTPSPRESPPEEEEEVEELMDIMAELKRVGIMNRSFKIIEDDEGFEANKEVPMPIVQTRTPTGSKLPTRLPQVHSRIPHGRPRALARIPHTRAIPQMRQQGAASGIPQRTPLRSLATGIPLKFQLAKTSGNLQGVDGASVAFIEKILNKSINSIRSATKGMSMPQREIAERKDVLFLINALNSHPRFFKEFEEANTHTEKLRAMERRLKKIFDLVNALLIAYRGGN